MKTALMMFLILLGVFGLTAPGWTAKVYVTDSFEITLRTGPSIENKIVSMLCSARPLEVLETRGEWSRVKVLDDNKEGWVLNRYLITRIPWEIQVGKLQEELASLTEKIRTTQKDLGDKTLEGQSLAGEVKKKTEELELLRREYLELKQGAEGYLELKTLYEAREKRLKAVQHELSKLAAENDELKSSEQNRWFLSGALVLLCGLLIGGITGRQQAKRRTLYG